MKMTYCIVNVDSEEQATISIDAVTAIRQEEKLIEVTLDKVQALDLIAELRHFVSSHKKEGV